MPVSVTGFSRMAAILQTKCLLFPVNASVANMGEFPDATVFMRSLCEMAAGHLEFLCMFSHLSVSGARAPAGLKDRTMTLFHSHPGDLPAGARHLHVARVLGRLGTAFKTIHDAIVAAKLRRLQSELMFHECWPAQTDTDATKSPRRPIILGDKWDF